VLRGSPRDSFAIITIEASSAKATSRTTSGISHSREACGLWWMHTTFSWLSQRNWYARRDEKNGRWYAVRTMQLPNGKRMTQHMARVIMGEPEGMEIDHIDRDATLINLESNLRIATHAQNTWNQRLRNSNTSGVVGVTWDKPRPANRMKSGRWRAQIDHNGKKIHLGLFNTAVEAASVYNWASKVWHGPFGVQNDLSKVTVAQLRGFAISKKPVQSVRLNERKVA